MSRKHTYIAYSIRAVFCLLCLFCGMQKATAQFDNSLINTSVLSDTLVANSNKEFLFNSITITNQTNQKVSVLVKITPPKGWSSVSPKETTLSLEANQSTIVPVRLTPSASRNATWEKVQVEYRINGAMTGPIDTFRVRVKEFSKFKATLLISNTVLAAYQRNLTFPVFIKNMGNTPDVYTIKYSNDLLNLNEKVSFPIGAGADTTYNLNVRLSDGQWSLLRKEDIKVLVSASNEETVNLAQSLSKIGSTLKENSTAYLDVPLQLEVGTMFQGQGNMQFYGAVRGTVDITDEDRIAVDYRSNTYMVGQVINNSIVRAEYTGKHVFAVAGNLMEVSDFFMDGYGAKLGYKWSNKTYASLFGMFKSRIGDVKTGGGHFGYRIGENAAGGNSLLVNIDNVRKINGYIANQKLNMTIGENAKLSLLGGIGFEQTGIQLSGNAKQQLLGSQYGYNFEWENKRYSILSNVANNSNSFPGIYKGQRQQIHEVRALRDASFFGAFYEYTYRKQNYFLDTALFSNVFNIRTNNYGVRYGHNFKRANVILSLGQQQQLQPTDQPTDISYYFTYANMNLATTLWEKLTFMTNSYIGYAALNNPGNNAMLISSNQAALQYSNFGLSLRYDNGPYYYHEYVAYTKAPDKYQRLILSPYVDFSFFKRALNIRTQFNYAKTTPNTTEISNLLGNLTYSSQKHGIDFNISGIIPVKQENTSPYFNAALRFQLHAPLVFVREYYDVRVILFRDANGDGMMQGNEEPIAGQMLAINGNLFITNEKGIALFKNISKGVFKADFGYSSKIKGWIPVSGALQSFEVSGNRTYYVPYKKSKVIQGKLTLTADQNSNLSFNVNNIKVIATSGTDSLTTYTTITDASGEFYFNVPDGDYIVTLSPLAFDDNFQPVQAAQKADMLNNEVKNLYFEVKQKKRGINIKKKE